MLGTRTEPQEAMQKGCARMRQQSSVKGKTEDLLCYVLFAVIKLSGLRVLIGNIDIIDQTTGGMSCDCPYWRLCCPAKTGSTGRRNNWIEKYSVVSSRSFRKFPF